MHMLTDEMLKKLNYKAFFIHSKKKKKSLYASEMSYSHFMNKIY